MSFSLVSVPEWLASRDQFDTLIDVRSPSEFAEDHLPGAVNWPVLDDDERARVGTIYKQVSTFEARKLGAALVARRIADTLEQQVAGRPRDWRPLVYCWRGGQRSGSLSLVLAQIGFRTRQLGGGYKAFRGQVREDLERWPGTLVVKLLQGRTGSGKTRLLGSLAAHGGQTLDLEALAGHRGSVLGALPNEAPQPSQKMFETRLWSALSALDRSHPVYIEAESRRIGQLRLPSALHEVLQQPQQQIRVTMPLERRIELLLDDYRLFTEAPDALSERLSKLVELRGRSTIERWQQWVQQARWPDLLTELMTQHYDPLYDRTAEPVAGASASVTELPLPDGTGHSLERAALALLNSHASANEGRALSQP